MRMCKEGNTAKKNLLRLAGAQLSFFCFFFKTTNSLHLLIPNRRSFTHRTCSVNICGIVSVFEKKKKTPSVNPNVNCGLSDNDVCQHRLSNCNKCTAPVGMLIMGEAVQMWGQGGYMGNLWILHSTVLCT